MNALSWFDCHPDTLAERAEEVEQAIVSVARDVDFIALAPRSFLAPNAALLEEARERLNDALARLG